MEGQATVAGAVIMSAVEVGSGIAEQQRSRIHQRAAGVAAIEERPGKHDGDRHITMLFLEGAVLRSELTDDLVDTPAVTLGQCSRRWWPAGPILTDCQLILRG